jgi:hypothetical protein
MLDLEFERGRSARPDKEAARAGATNTSTTGTVRLLSKVNASRHHRTPLGQSGATAATVRSVKTIDLVKARFDLAKARSKIAKNMLVQSKRGLDWSREAFGDSQKPLQERQQLNDFETYFDAHETGRGIWKWQHYLPMYDRHFEKFRGREVHVVEIGVYSGGSLDMWREYFGPLAHIYGVDVAPECKVYEEPGVEIFIGDQADPDFWKRFVSQVPRVDIVIDDGGHKLYQQVATLEALLPHMRPGGVYVCEDLVGEYNGFLDYAFGLSRALHTYRPPTKIATGRPPSDAQSVIDSMHFYPYVTVIEKREERLEGLSCPKHGTEWQPTEFWGAARESRTSHTLGSNPRAL